MYSITFGYDDKLMEIVIEKDNKILHTFNRIKTSDTELKITQNKVVICVLYYNKTTKTLNKIGGASVNGSRVKFDHAKYNKESIVCNYNDRTVTIDLAKNSIQSRRKIGKGNGVKRTFRNNTYKFNPAVNLLVYDISKLSPTAIKESENVLTFEFDDDTKGAKAESMVLDRISELAIFL